MKLKEVLQKRKYLRMEDVKIIMVDYKILYVQVSVHRDKLRIKQPTRCIRYPKFISS